MNTQIWINASTLAQTLGWVEVQDGCYLNTAQSIISEQSGWDEADGSKKIDFTKAPFWITTDNGCAPQPIYDEQDFKEVIA